MYLQDAYEYVNNINLGQWRVPLTRVSVFTLVVVVKTNCKGFNLYISPCSLLQRKTPLFFPLHSTYPNTLNISQLSLQHNLEGYSKTLVYALLPSIKIVLSVSINGKGTKAFM